MRIVSLVPSISASLCRMGFKDQMVACTTFCVDPVGLAKSCAVVGGTKDPDISAIKSLNPTHIFVNQEENRKEDVQQLMQIAPVDISFPVEVEDLVGDFYRWGEFLGHSRSGAKQAEELKNLIAEQRRRRQSLGTALYLIWKQPYMAAARSTYIDSILHLLGFENILHEERYPEISISRIQELSPDHIFLSSEPYPFRVRDYQEMKPQVLGSQFWKVDGRAFSWHGSYAIELLDEYIKDGMKASGLFKPLAGL